MTHNFLVILEQEKEGGFSVSVHSLSGCYSQGEDFDDTIENAKEAISLYLEHEPAPSATYIIWSGLALPENIENGLLKLSPHYIATRYPEDIDELFKTYSKKGIEGIIKETEGILKWLKTKIK